MGLDDLEQMMADLQTYKDENLIVGYERSEDAGVYALSEDIALVESVDFITPIVDDPFVYGQIAASNALSDIFAMGAIPKTALNLLMWDQEHLSKEVIKEILKGGASKLKEAKVTLLGGHTIGDLEQKYGLSVSGIAHPQKIWKNHTAQIGDALILTKPLGSGILTTALKNHQLAFDLNRDVILSMKQLNLKASEIAKDFCINACTDVTGFGLIGHLLEMCGKDKSLEIYAEKIPLFDDVLTLIAQGVIPSGSRKNYDFLLPKVASFLGFEESIAYFDAQTSGGLLLALPKEHAPSLLDLLKKGGYERSAMIGEFFPKKERPIALL